MVTKVKTSKDYPTVFQITQVDKDKFVLLGVMNKKQLEAILWRLEEEYESKSRQWRGQYQALAKAIVEARENFEKSDAKGEIDEHRTK
jgi:hypothetical protein